MLQSYIHPALGALEAARITPLLGLAALPGTMVAMAVCGRWSDRIGRRKPFVIASSLLFAVALAVPLVSPTLPALFVQAVLIGLALGCFMVVDQALMIDVLPDQAAAGRDLGIGILAINLGQAIAPAVAGGIVAATGDYTLIWVVGVVTVLVATAAILPVKRAR
jgi:MFS family permease